MEERYPFIAVYIIASGRNGTLYIGVTSNLWARVWEHKNGKFDGFASKYGCTRLVWFERHHFMPPAIQREKSLKRYERKWKLDLIEAENAEWRDLSHDWYPETTNRWLIDPDNP